MNEPDIDNALDDLFKALGDETQDVPPALLARVQDDALAAQPVREAKTRRSFWQEIVSGLGGWAPVGGLVAACSIGVVIGLNPAIDSNLAVSAMWGLEADAADDTSGDQYFGWDVEEAAS